MLHIWHKTREQSKWRWERHFFPVYSIYSYCRSSMNLCSVWSSVFKKGCILKVLGLEFARREEFWRGIDVLQMNFATTSRGLRMFHQLQSLKLIYSRTFYSTSQPAEHFSGCSATFSWLCCPQCNRKAGLTSIYSSRPIRTSSLKRACSNFNDAFSETNKVRFVKQLGGMKTRKSLLASCSEEAAVFVPFCVVDSVPSVLFTLRSNKLNKHRGEVRSVLSSRAS